MSPRTKVDRTRRRVLATGVAAACAAAWPLAHAGARVEVRESRALMGTRVDIALKGGSAAALREAARAAFARMASLAAVMSHYRRDSEVAAINLAAGLVAVPAAPELLEVLRMARDVSQRSAGAFDVTVGSLGQWHFDAAQPHGPSAAEIRRGLANVDWRYVTVDDRAGTVRLARRGTRIDPGGIAKLYILQQGLLALQERGVPSALVNGGGDVVATTHASDPAWRVGLRDPRVPQRLLAALEVREGFVASSGNYERFFMRGGRRWHHVLDPRTGEPTQGPSGVTLVGHTLEAVNGLGTAIMVLGDRAGRDLVARTPGTEALIASAGGSLWASPPLRERLVSPA